MDEQTTMDEQTYETFRQMIEGGQVVTIGNLTATTVDELDYLRDAGVVKPGTEQVIADLTDQTVALTQKNADLTTQNAALTDDKKALTAENAALAAQVSDLQKQNADLTQKNADLNAQITASQKAAASAKAAPQGVDPVKAVAEAAGTGTASGQAS